MKPTRYGIHNDFSGVGCGRTRRRRRYVLISNKDEGWGMRGEGWGTRGEGGGRKEEGGGKRDEGWGRRDEGWGGYRCQLAAVGAVASSILWTTTVQLVPRQGYFPPGIWLCRVRRHIRPPTSHQWGAGRVHPPTSRKPRPSPPLRSSGLDLARFLAHPEPPVYKWHMPRSCRVKQLQPHPAREKRCEKKGMRDEGKGMTDDGWGRRDEGGGMREKG